METPFPKLILSDGGMLRKVDYLDRDYKAEKSFCVYFKRLFEANLCSSPFLKAHVGKT